MTEQKNSHNQKMIDDWLAAGNKITICPPGETSDGELPGYGWGKKKKKAKTAKKKSNGVLVK